MSVVPSSVRLRTMRMVRYSVRLPCGGAVTNGRNGGTQGNRDRIEASRGHGPDRCCLPSCLSGHRGSLRGRCDAGRKKPNPSACRPYRLCAHLPPCGSDATPAARLEEGRGSTAREGRALDSVCALQTKRGLRNTCDQEIRLWVFPPPLGHRRGVRPDPTNETSLFSSP